VPIYNDVRTLQGADVPSVDVLVGGFPCQDVSSGGKRAGITQSTRSGLWYEYSRLIGAIRPRYAVIENVKGLLSGSLETYRTFPPLGTMRSGHVFPQPRSGLLTCGRECSLLPTPTVTTLAESLGFYLRSGEIWERSTSLGACLIGLAYGLTGRQERPSGKYMAEVSFVEWMMGVPEGWTAPEGESLSGR
jgi:hypothetical protein